MNMQSCDGSLPSMTSAFPSRWIASRMKFSAASYNWLLVILFINGLPKSEEARSLVWSQLRIAMREPETAFALYQTIKKAFTQRINKDREDLRSAGITEPAFGLYRTNEDGERVINEEIANSYGSALSVLYHFRSDKFILLHTPTQ